MATQYDPILKDSTGQAIVTKLEGIKNAINPTAENIPITTIEGMEAENVQEGLEELKQSLDEKAKVAFLSSGSMQSITESGLYYLANVVTDKPDATGGYLAISFASSTVGAGVYLPNTSTGKCYQVSVSSGTWTYTEVNKVTDIDVGVSGITVKRSGNTITCISALGAKTKSSSGWLDLFTLPTGSRPATDVYYVAYDNSASTAKDVSLQCKIVASTGVCSVYFMSDRLTVAPRFTVTFLVG